MNDVIMFLLAILPIICLIIALTGFKLPGHIACPITLVVAGIVAFFVWHMSPVNLFSAALEGIVMAIWPISVVIIAAIFTYNVCLHTGAMDVIKRMLTAVSCDKRILVLLIAWGFGGFMEGMAGFGTAIAIPAGILCGLGFEPIMAAVICLIADSTPTCFGSVGIPTVTLAKLTGLDPANAAFATALQIAPLVILTPFIMVILTGKSIKAMKGMWLTTLLSGLTFALPQILVAKFMGPELTDILASILTMVVLIVISKLKKGEVPAEYKMELPKEMAGEKTTAAEGLRACSPFILIFILLLATSKIVTAINTTLGSIKTSIQIYQGQGATPTVFTWLTSPAVLILLAGIIGGKIQGASFKEIGKVLVDSIKQMSKTVVTIASIVAAAMIMKYSGMSNQIAVVLVAVTGSFYPAVAPVIGSIAGFVTGSGTSSNVLFGGLQLQTAKSLNFDPTWICAANSAGSNIGKMISPQSIAIALAAINMPGQEGKLMGKSIRYYVLFILLTAIICFAGLKLLY
ncbi:MAG: L-lactate permease [Inconstantimicrobium porci]|uniref:L-lactate permease n=2 Tax=Inconstantimicrobium porci TaxID=2652291 RepID=UPI002A910156|nr:L-lactate permease [Inconstantimicrobium porci]MDY5912411.1 L-lactate permease [Inconstantimicrobium porci]